MREQGLHFLRYLIFPHGWGNDSDHGEIPVLVKVISSEFDELEGLAPQAIENFKDLPRKCSVTIELLRNTC